MQDLVPKINSISYKWWYWAQRMVFQALAGASLLSFCADGEAKVVKGHWELVNTVLHVGFGSCVEWTVIDEQKLVDDISLHLCMKPSEIEDTADSAVSYVDSNIQATKASNIIAENMMLKRVGAKIHPCLSQLVTGKATELSPLSCTLACRPSWNCQMRNFSGQPYFAMILQRPSRLTVSNALVRSI